MYRPTKSVLSRTIKTARLELGLTQKAFGQRIGINSYGVNAWENAYGVPTDKTLDAIVSVFSINKKFLEYGTGDIFDHNRTDNNFILKASDTLTDAQLKLSSYEVAKCRLGNLMWPLYNKQHTDIKFKSNDNVVIYTVGRRKHSRAFIAIAKIDMVLDYKKVRYPHTAEPTDKVPTRVLLLKNVCCFDQPVNLVDIIDKLSFSTMDKKQLGYLVRNGCTNLTSDDLNIIQRAAFTHLKSRKQ